MWQLYTYQLVQYLKNFIVYIIPRTELLLACSVKVLYIVEHVGCGSFLGEMRVYRWVDMVGQVWLLRQAPWNFEPLWNLWRECIACKHTFASFLGLLSALHI